MGKDNDTVEIPIGKYLSGARNNPWKATTVILVLIVLGLVIFNPLGSGSGSISANSAGKQALEFLNSNPNIDGEVALVSVEKQGSFYEAVLSYQGQDVPVYLTLDGNYMLPGRPISLLEPIPAVGNNVPTTTPIEVDLGDDAVLGSADAPITIIEFSDYQCPFCKKFWTETLPELKEKYVDTGKAKLIYKDFPLAIHPKAQIAAEATECVRDLGGDNYFWLMHDKIFESQSELSEDNLVLWAQSLGFEISTCLESGKFTDEVKDDLQYGTSLGVDGTPAFFVNGQKISGAQPFSAFEQIIEAELAA